MSALIICEDHKRKAKEMADFAARSENWYRPGDAAHPPGEAEGHVAYFESYRCVFSHTLHEGQLFRHLSISVGASPPALPHPIAVLTIASWFGFTGGGTKPGSDAEVVLKPGPDWQMAVLDEPIPHVALGQRIGRAEGP